MTTQPTTADRTDRTAGAERPLDTCAAVRRRYGTADDVAIERIARPTIADDQVLVEVGAAGLDRGVWHLVTGLPYLVRLVGYGLRRPKQPVLGGDVAGRVVEVGPGVTRFAPGDEVMGIADGSFAEWAVADEAKLVHRPGNVAVDEAAVAPISGSTALQALTEVAQVQPGDRVLVVGASGGVGTFAVQLAVALGAEVTGVASTAKLDLVRSLGAVAVVDHTTTALTDLDERFDVIVDTGGRNRLRDLRSVLAPSGTLVIVGGEGAGKITGGIGRQIRAALWSPFLRQRLVFFMGEEDRRLLEPLADHLADGSVVPAIGRRCTLDEVPEALRLMEAGRLAGKTVIEVGARS
ncbi:MAG: NAD(P)-dependent alcohol dehydrogenase [Actinomycetota bacterium]